MFDIDRPERLWRVRSAVSWIPLKDPDIPCTVINRKLKKKRWNCFEKEFIKKKCKKNPRGPDRRKAFNISIWSINWTREI